MLKVIANFANIQASHIIPISNSKVNAVRTGYEAVLPYRVSDKYVTSAKEDGVVTSVTDKYLEVNYKTTGKNKIALKEWTTKEESGSTYTHKLDTNLTKGDKFKYGDTLAYDKAFFEIDIFDKNKVVFKSGTTFNTVLTEDIQTFEDSTAISAKASKKISTVVTKVKSVVVNNTDEIVDLLKVGDTTEPNTLMFSITDASVLKLKGLSPDALAALKRLKKASPKVKYRGVVRKLKLFYNSEFEEMSESLQELAKISNKSIQAEHNNNKYTGQVNSGYSIQGVPLQPGQVEIKMYVDVKDAAGIGDKTIISNQLKNTIGEVFDYKVTTENNEEIECFFGAKSVANRIVNSAFIVGTTTKLLEVLSDRAVAMYEG